jgi:hypothetical protein
MPRSTIPMGDAVETAALGLAGRASSHPVAFDPWRGLGTHFVVISGPDLTACTLAVYASRSRSPVYFCTISQDSLPAWRSPSSPVGFSPRVTLRNFGLLHAFLSDQAFLAHATSTSTTAVKVKVQVDVNRAWDTHA